mmetsp:Transcript_1219/g.3346  ORF Transcript_1219/g.3346 Transcript_1219/m.3346 type:complete len:234 (+) Transcript_1219:861-1562(+)
MAQATRQRHHLPRCFCARVLPNQVALLLPLGREGRAAPAKHAAESRSPPTADEPAPARQKRRRHQRRQQLRAPPQSKIQHRPTGKVWHQWCVLAPSRPTPPTQHAPKGSATTRRLWTRCCQQSERADWGFEAPAEARWHKPRPPVSQGWNPSFAVASTLCPPHGCHRLSAHPPALRVTASMTASIPLPWPSRGSRTELAWPLLSHHAAVEGTAPRSSVTRCWTDARSLASLLA